MSSYAGFGQNLQYPLPFQSEAVPTSFKSNSAPRPINAVLATVVVPSTSGATVAGGLSSIQVPLGNNSYMANPYLRFRVAVTTGGNSARRFKGAAGTAASCIASYQSSINSTLIDNIINYPQVADILMCHATSSSYLTRDGSVLFNAGTETANGAQNVSEVYVLPLLGLLASQQAFPAYLVQGTLQLNINWSSINAMFAGTAAADSILTAAISDVALVYDRITIETDFINKMRADMMATGAKFIYNFTNYQSLSAVSAQQNTISTGINVSSLRAVTMTTVLTSDLTAQNTRGFSLRHGLSNFQVALDGRQVSNVTLDAATAPAIVFAELNKTYSRLFDSAVDDLSTKATYLTESFAAGVNCCRVAEGLSFQGSPVSVVSINLSQTDATFTNFITYISDQSLIIGVDGQCDIVR